MEGGRQVKMLSSRLSGNGRLVCMRTIAWNNDRRSRPVLYYKIDMKYEN